MQTSVTRNTFHKFSHEIVKMLMLTNRQRHRHTEINELRFTTYCCESAKHWRINYRVAYEKPARRLVEQRGRRSRTLHRELNKCKCKVLIG
jgi:hypothetical protein